MDLLRSEFSFLIRGLIGRILPATLGAVIPIAEKLPDAETGETEKSMRTFFVMWGG